MLTFDDGHKSLKQSAFPLLKKYGLSAVAFIVPGLVPNSPGVKNWKPGQQALCTWSEIGDMHRSGIVDFQSHSLYHHTIFVAPQIIEYITPNRCPTFLQEWLFPVSEGDPPVFPDSLPLGTPLYESDSRFAEYRRYQESDEVRNACTELVADEGGPDFFRQKQWKRKLDRVASQALKTLGRADYESARDRAAAIRDNLRRSKAIIEQALEGKRVRHFSFPWFSGSALSSRISAEEGFVSNFGGWTPPQSRLTGPWRSPISWVVSTQSSSGGYLGKGVSHSVKFCETGLRRSRYTESSNQSSFSLDHNTPA